MVDEEWALYIPCPFRAAFTRARNGSPKFATSDRPLGEAAAPCSFTFRYLARRGSRLDEVIVATLTVFGGTALSESNRHESAGEQDRTAALLSSRLWAPG